MDTAKDTTVVDTVVIVAEDTVVMEAEDIVVMEAEDTVVMEAGDTVVMVMEKDTVATVVKDMEKEKEFIYQGERIPNKFRKKNEKKKVSDLRNNKLLSSCGAGVYVCRGVGRGIGYGT
jgi:hypothetical protein